MDRRKIIEEPVKAEFQRFKAEFTSSLSSSTLKLQFAIDKIMSSSGKHIRPLLVLLAAKACGKVAENTINSAVLLEQLHTASLIHDDVIDNTRQRRGVPSLNAFLDNRVSVLVGDYIMSSALIRSIQTGNIRIMYIISEVGRALAEGEIRQLEVVEDIILDEDSYLEIIKKKTAILISACTEVGAITAGASEELITYCKQIGEYLGYCFQIKDDIFDYYSNLNIGKPTGNDILEGKVTLPLLYALRKTEEADSSYYLQLIEKKDFTPSHIDELILFAKENGGIEYAELKMKEYRDKVVEIMHKLPHSDARNSLIELADYIIERKK
ncbi:MAG: polyprenyl synthetase family protein [Tannerellaceae bacterium]|jgi:octaprenyl-diphosphate synthase|nr:polyprenyl synthetase family protein [Tannerellaceae bacterium]